jgi:exodeoxyribonuclease V alpha subunit
VRDKKHGLQFKATVLKAVLPTTREGVERYLAGGFVKRVGPVLAKKLVGHFGPDVLGVIENNSGDLESVDGIGPKRRERITNAWQDGMQIREIMLFLHGLRDRRECLFLSSRGQQNSQSFIRRLFV